MSSSFLQTKFQNLHNLQMVLILFILTTLAFCFITSTKLQNYQNLQPIIFLYVNPVNYGIMFFYTL